MGGDAVERLDGWDEVGQGRHNARVHQRTRHCIIHGEASGGISCIRGVGSWLESMGEVVSEAPEVSRRYQVQRLGESLVLLRGESDMGRLDERREI